MLKAFIASIIPVALMAAMLGGVWAVLRLKSRRRGWYNKGRAEEGRDADRR